jgi:hypothetical protein
MTRGSRTVAALTAALLVALALPALALAHIERPSYWPDPSPDTSVKPAAGGKVPKARPLSTALNDRLPGDTHVVCQRNSMNALHRPIIGQSGGPNSAACAHRARAETR